MSKTRPYVPHGIDQQGRLPGPDCSMCDPDLLTPNDRPKRRLGPIGGFTRWALRNKQRGQMLLVFVAIGSAYYLARNS